MRTRHPRRGLALLPALLLLVPGLAPGCGGNYSNEDIDFQLALPEREDLTVKLPGQALLAPDAAEYYLATRDVVTKVNAVVLAVTGIVNHVRAFPASERRGDSRIWGPFPHERDPAFELRMTMLRKTDADGLRYDYLIEFHRVNAQPPAAWHALITGTFFPLVSARPNAIALDLVEARRQSYPVADFNELEALQIEYQRRVAPYTARMTVRNVPEAPAPGATYAYSENADRSGEMTFVWRVRDNVWVAAAELSSRWIASGAGRADARIVEGLAAVAAGRGVDCWGPDARATYVRRDWGERREEGNAASCVLPEPPP